MKDFLGNTVEVGDTVIFSLPNYRYTLIKGTVTKITKCYFFIEYLNPAMGSTNYYSKVKQDPSQVVKAPERPNELL
jgi:hypothetical protein